MLDDAGSIASLAGVGVSLVGLGFSILQLRKLRGETRAAREAVEATCRAIGRELPNTELTRLGERMVSFAFQEAAPKSKRNRAMRSIIKPMGLTGTFAADREAKDDCLGGSSWEKGRI